jgi:ribosome-binding protein aMBF1 (putative translation factor)
MKREKPDEYRQYLDDAKVRTKKNCDKLKNEISKRRPSVQNQQQHSKIREQTKERVKLFRARQREGLGRTQLATAVTKSK